MIEQIIPTHHIQKHIISVLLTSEYARFRDLRPEKTDTNLFTYHLKLLMKQNLVKKSENGYTLSQNGLAYVDRVNAEKVFVRSQPKIISMLLVQDGYGKVLLQRRNKQPFINTWTLPYGKLHIEDEALTSAAMREAKEKLDFVPKNLRHAGDCYIRVQTDDGLLSTTLAHVFRFETDDIQPTDDLQWVSPLKLPTLRLAPAVEQIVARSFFGDQHFFEEFDVEYTIENPPAE